MSDHNLITQMTHVPATKDDALPISYALARAWCPSMSPMSFTPPANTWPARRALGKQAIQPPSPSIALWVTSFTISFNLARVQLGLFVVVYPYEKDVAGVFGQLCWIILTLYLVEGGVGGMIELQFDNQCRFVDVSTGNHHKVGIAFASGIFAVDNVFVSCPDISNCEHAG